MTASPGIPRARIMPSRRTRDAVTTSPPHPVYLRLVTGSDVP